MESLHVAIIVVIAIACGTAIIITAITAFQRSRLRRATSAPDLSRLETQIQSLQQSVDSIALEVERISEGQRFTTRLLSEQGAPRVGAPR